MTSLIVFSTCDQNLAHYNRKMTTECIYGVANAVVRIFFNTSLITSFTERICIVCQSHTSFTLSSLCNCSLWIPESLNYETVFLECRTSKLWLAESSGQLLLTKKGEETQKCWQAAKYHRCTVTTREGRTDCSVRAGVRN